MLLPWGAWSDSAVDLAGVGSFDLAEVGGDAVSVAAAASSLGQFGGAPATAASKASQEAFSNPTCRWASWSVIDTWSYGPGA